MFPKIYALIYAFYQHIVKLWCHATYFVWVKTGSSFGIITRSHYLYVPHQKSRSFKSSYPRTCWDHMKSVGCKVKKYFYRIFELFLLIRDTSQFITKSHMPPLRIAGNHYFRFIISLTKYCFFYNCLIF